MAREMGRVLQAGTALGGTLLGLVLSPGAQAAPQGGQVVAGQAQFVQKSPAELDIIQKSARLVLNWSSFNIATGETVHFIQGANFTALNEIAGGPSLINGHLFADARLILINAAGLTFGNQALVQVGSLVATSANIAEPDFIRGRYAFTQAGQASAAIINQGSINAAQGGLVAFVAPSVANAGVITARLGKVALAAGSSFFLDLYGDHLVNLVVGAPVAAQVANSGTIAADGGMVQLTAASAKGVVDGAINMSGVIQAQAVASRGGTIVLEGGSGATTVSGTLDASGGGGTVKVLGNQVALASTARIDVSGAAGGGVALIGGNFHGAGPEQNAQTTTVSAGAVIDADATGLGNGGRVAVWSDGETDMAGTITVRGGAQGGNGGLVETAGRRGLMLGTSTPDASAAHGQSGTWLLDPDAVVISNATNSTVISSGTTTIGTSLLIQALAKADVVVETDVPVLTGTTSGGSPTTPGSITVSNALIYGSTNSLLLLSQGGITVAASIQNTLATGGGAVALVAGWNGVTGNSFTTALVTGGVSAGGILAAIAGGHAFGGAGGTVQIGQAAATGTLGIAVGSASGQSTVLARDVTLQGSSGDGTTGAFAQIGFNPGAAGITTPVNATGAISLGLTGGLVLQGGAGANAYAQIGHGGSSQTLNASGAITVTAPGGAVLVAGGSGLGAYAQIGHGGLGADANVNGDVTLTGAVTVIAGSGVTVAGGSASEAYAQIGHGGFEFAQRATGNISLGGAVTVNAGGLLAMTGGALDAYAQIGHGGDEQGNAAQHGSVVVSGSVSVGATGVLLAGGKQDAYAQLGDGGLGWASFSGGVTGAVAVITGDIGVQAGSGRVTLAGGGQDAYAQLGNGGFGWAGFSGRVPGAVAVITGNIGVQAGSGGVTLAAGGGEDAYAQIGHGGGQALRNSSFGGASGIFGAISLVTSGGLAIMAGGGEFAYAQLGHGGLEFAQVATVSGGTLQDSGAITVSAASVSLQGGSSSDAYAQLGHGGADAFLNATLSGAGSSGNFGAVSLTTGGGLTLMAGSGEFAYAQLGHGGLDFGSGARVSGESLQNSGAITVSAASVDLQGQGTAPTGTTSSGDTDSSGNTDAYAQLGHGGDQAFSVAMLSGAGSDGNFGAISVNASGGLTLASGPGSNAYAQLGHGGLAFGGGATVSGGSLQNSGAITVGVASVSLQGGSNGSDAYAQIGHGGLRADEDVNGDVTVTGAITVIAGTSVTVAGGSASEAYAQIGHGGLGADEANENVKGDVTLAGAITVIAGSSVTAAGGSGTDAYAQIGHGGGLGADENVKGNITLTGAITVIAGSGVTVAGGGGTDAYAQIGHGGFAFAQGATGNISLGGAVTVSAGGLLAMTGGALDAYAQIGHGGSEESLDGAGAFQSGSVVVSGSVSVGAAGVLLAGGDARAYAQLGDGGFGWASFSGEVPGAVAVITGDIGVQAGSGGVTLAGNGSGDAYAQIGDGGDRALRLSRFGGASGIFGAISLATSGGLTLMAGGGENAYAQIGHGGFDFAQNATVSGGTLQDSGAITVGAASVSLQGSSSANSLDAYVQIGHGGADAFLNTAVSGAGSSGNFGAIGLTTGGGLTLTAGSGTQDYAQLGHGGFSVGDDARVSGGNLQNSGAITVSAASVSLQGGSNTSADAYAQLGHGGGDSFFQAMLSGSGSGSSGNFGAISLATGGGLTLMAGAGKDAYAQLGHGGFAFGDFATVSGGSLQNSGAITVSAASIGLRGGTGGTDAYAQIGHGAADGSAQGVASGTVDVRAQGLLALSNGNGATNVALIGNDASGGVGADTPVFIAAGALQDSFVPSGATAAATTGIGDALAGSIANDLRSGDVTIAVHGLADIAVQTSSGSLSYASANTLNLVTAGNLVITGTISNAGGTVGTETTTGGMNLVAGWDGHTGLSATPNGTFNIAAVQGGMFGRAFAAHGRAVQLAGATLTSNGGAVSSTGLVVIQGSGTIDTTDGLAAAANGANITLGKVEGTTPQGDGLTLSAGSAGNVAILRDAGEGLRLGPFVIASADNLSFGAIGASSLDVQDLVGAMKGRVDVGTLAVTSGSEAASAALTGEISGFTTTAAAKAADVLTLTAIPPNTLTFTLNGSK